MTTEHIAPLRSDTTVSAANGPSVHVVRARKLLFGGLAGGLLGAIASLILFGVRDGAAGLGSAALAAAMVLFFYTAGQLVMVAFADAGARLLLAVALASYTTRVMVLGLVLMLYSRNRDAFESLVPMAIFVTTMLIVAGWLIVEVIVFSRLRIEAYDTPYVAPPSVEGEQ